MSNNRHKFFDGLAETRIYGVIKNCTCSWCQKQRAEASRNHSHQQHTEHHGRGADTATSPEAAGDFLDKLARQVSKRDGISYLDALAYAHREHPEVAQLYSEGLSMHARYRGEQDE